MSEQNVEIEISEDAKALAIQRLSALASGKKISLSEVFEALVPEIDRVRVVAKASPPKPPALTDVQRAALKRLPQIYGQVAPEEYRALTQEEAALLVEERQTIDAILGVIGKRKDESIRETIANHLDKVYETEHADDEHAFDVPLDSKGHYQVKHDWPIPGTDQKFQKTISEPKPQISAAAIEQAHKDGLIDRKTYLKITKLPEVSRVINEDGLVKAMKADPSLMFTLARLTNRPASTTTIKVAKNG